MTGLNYRKIRYYSHVVSDEGFKEDVNLRANMFRQANSILINQERLIANVSIKAAMPSSDSDGKKRGLEKSKSKYTNLQGMVYDPNGKWAPNKMFKSYVTETERIDALKTTDPVPNWGWLDKQYPVNSQPSPKGVKVKITEHEVNPRTGEPSKTGIEIKAALGATIREMNPGQNIGSRAAKAFGVIVDALGKFRCPPGTPAANRFTNERGEGCFSLGQSAQLVVGNIVRNLSDVYSGDKSTLTQTLLRAGVSAVEIRETFKGNGIMGLRSLVDKVRDMLVGDDYVDASYRKSVLKNIISRKSSIDESVSGIRRETEKRQDLIDEMLNEYGIAPTEDNSDMVELMKKMQEQGLFSETFNPSDLFIGGTAESHRMAMVDHIFGGLQNSGLNEADKAQYLEDSEKGVNTPLVQYVDLLLKREQDYQRGALQGIVKMQQKHPEAAKKISIQSFLGKEVKQEDGSIKVVSDPNYHAETGWSDDENGLYVVTINPEAALKGLPPLPDTGKTHLYTAEGGMSQEDQWLAIANELSHHERMRTWVETHMTDLAASQGNGWEDMGAEVGIHEFMHVLQFEALAPLIEKISGKSIKELSNSEIADYQNAILLKPEKLLPAQSEAIFDNLREVFGTDIFDLVETRLDALAGSYSQDTQQQSLALLKEFNETGDLKVLQKYNTSLVVAMLETLAELGAAREMGLVNGKDIDEALSFMDNPVPPAPISIESLPSKPTLWIPGPGGTWVDNSKPNVPTDAPTPVVPSRPRPKPLVPGLTDTVIDEKEMEDAWGLNIPDSSGIPNEPKDLSKTPGRGRRSIITKKIVEGELSPTEAFEFETKTQNYLKGDGRFSASWKEARALMSENFGTTNLDDLSDEQILQFQDLLRIKAAESRARLKDLEGRLARGEYVRPNAFDMTTDMTGAEGLEKAIEKEKNRARALSQQASSIGDIYDIRKWKNSGSPMTPSYSPIIRENSVPTIFKGQRAIMTPDEIKELDGAIKSNPQIGLILASNTNSVRSMISDEQEITRAFKDNGLDVPEMPNSSPSAMVKNAKIMSAIDKSELLNDIVVEMELASVTPDSTFEINDISKASLIVEPPTSASRSSLASRKLSIAANLIGSKRSKKLMGKMGISDDNAETLEFVSSMALAFGTVGPAGVAAVLLRRGGRDAADYGLRKAVQEGWIDPTIAAKLESQILNRVAPEGLPKDIVQSLERSKDYLVTDANKQKARDIVSAVEGRISDFDVFGKVSDIKESVADFETADSARNAASNVRNRLRRRENQQRIDEMLPSSSPFDDPFSSPPVAISPEYDPFAIPDAFKSLQMSFKQDQTSTSSRKEKVRIVVPSGMRGALTGPDGKNVSIMLPPGKIKFSQRDSDGFITGEMESQKTTEDYFKSVEKAFKPFTSDDDFDVRTFASTAVNAVKKESRDRRLTNGSSSSLSNVSKSTLEKSERIIEESMDKGINPFKAEEISNSSNTFPIDEIYERYEDSISEGIALAKSEKAKLLTTSRSSEKVEYMLKTKSESEIKAIITSFAVAVHEGFDRRTRISLSPDEIDYLAESGKIKVSQLPTSAAELKKKKDISIGLANESVSLDSTSLDLMHISQIDSAEESMYLKGTRVGSEEFFDSGFDALAVLRAENAVRIGYGKTGTQDYPSIFVGMTDDDESQIELAIFGDISSSPEAAAQRVLEILEAISSNDINSILVKNGEKVFTARIIGEISLSDIEHVKISSRLLGIQDSAISSDDVIAGDEAIRAMLISRGASADKIQSFINDGGVLKRNPRYFQYLREIPKATEVKEKLISSGIPEVIFVNKDGIDILSDSTWGEDESSDKIKGIEKLRKLAEKEISTILDSVQKKNSKDKVK